ncbi:MAG: hypothetical protein ACFE0Q_11960 [Anaerolineae bacterium]
MNNSRYRIAPFKTLAWWLAYSLFIWPMSIVALAMVGLPLLYLTNGLFYSQLYHPMLEMSLTVLGVPFAGVIFGACLAFLQRDILRTRLYWTADDWYRWTIIGSVAGVIVIGVLALIYPRLFWYNHNQLYVMPIFLTVLSLFQVVSLREAVKQTWLWVFAHLVGGVVFASVLRSAYDNPPHNDLLMMILAVLAVGLVTGIVLLFLFQRHLLPMQNPSDETPKQSPETVSLWDKAI